MAIVIFVAALLLSLLLPLFKSLILPSKKPAPKLPPGPPNLPIVGNLHLLGKLPHRSLFELSRKHGSLMFLKLGSVPTVVASSADAAKQFLKTHDVDSCSRPTSAPTAKLSYGRSDFGFAPYGPQWRQLRKICIAEYFSTKRIATFESARAEEIERMIDNISSKSTIDLCAALVSLSNDITCRSALGKRYFDGTSRLLELVRETQSLIGGFFFEDYMPGLGWLDVLTGMRARLQKNFSDLDRFYEAVIDERMDPAKRGLQHGGEDTVDSFLRIEKEEADITRENVKAMIMDIFIGGTDTSSAVAEWAMSELVRNPTAMKKAQDEVRGLVGAEGKVLESHLPQLRYLRCVVKEVMRLHTPIPLLVHRETMRPFKVNGFDIPAKTRVIINAWAIGRDEGLWERPEVFDPERFVDGSVDMKGQDFELIPFGSGRRVCPGMHVGLLVVELALANLLYAFNWELPEGTSRDDLGMDEAVGITVRRKTALRLRGTKWNFM